MRLIPSQITSGHCILCLNVFLMVPTECALDELCFLFFSLLHITLIDSDCQLCCLLWLIPILVHRTMFSPRILFSVPLLAPSSYGLESCGSSDRRRGWMEGINLSLTATFQPAFFAFQRPRFLLRLQLAYWGI